MSAKLKAVPAQRRMPVRTRRIDLDGEWEGWWYEARMNVPTGTLLLLAGVSEDKIEEGISDVLDFLAKITVAWNFVDEDGEDLPLGRAGCDRLPSDLVGECMAAFNRLASLPKA